MHKFEEFMEIKLKMVYIGPFFQFLSACANVNPNKCSCY